MSLDLGFEIVGVTESDLGSGGVRDSPEMGVCEVDIDMGRGTEMEEGERFQTLEARPGLVFSWLRQRWAVLGRWWSDPTTSSR